MPATLSARRTPAAERRGAPNRLYVLALAVIPCGLDRDSQEYATAPKHVQFVDGSRAVQDARVEQRGHGMCVLRGELTDGPTMSVVDRDAVRIVGGRSSPQCDRCTRLCPQRRSLVSGGNDHTQNRFAISAADGVHGSVQELKAGFDDIEPTAFTDTDDVVGVIHEDSGKTRAFSSIHGEFKLLSQAQSTAKAMNNHMGVVGELAGAPVLWRGGQFTRLGGCCGGRVFAINQRDEVAGELNDREGHYGAFVWDDKQGIQKIDVPGARDSTALAINDSSHVLIQSFSPNAIFLREDGKLAPVELSPEYASQPLALNDCNVIVGEYGAASDYYRAFVWDKKNGFRDLNTLIDKTEGWNLEQAVDINARGEIIGTGDHSNEGDEGFLLIPTEESTTAKPREKKP